jgi:hypothetical protein
MTPTVNLLSGDTGLEEERKKNEEESIKIKRRR